MENFEAKIFSFYIQYFWNEFGALSPNAVMALNNGAKMGNFAQDTGEGSISNIIKNITET